MERILQISVAVVGESHNPTILNPDFLRAEGIVPKSWGWKVEDSFTTPPFSTVQYSNGVSLIVEPKKLQVIDSVLEEGPENCKVADIATGYARTLKHVRYTAVGNNFKAVLEVQEPHERISSLFLKNGPWNTNPTELEGLAIQLLYPGPGDCRFGLSIDSGTFLLHNETQERRGIIASANFSRSITSNKPPDEVIEYLAMGRDDMSVLRNQLQLLFNEQRP